MPTETFDLPLWEWLYIFAASLGVAAGVTGASIAVLAATRRSLPEAGAGVLLATGGAAAVIFVWLAASDRTDLQFLESVNLGGIFDNVQVAIAVTAAPVVALVLVAAVAGAAFLAPAGWWRLVAMGIAPTIALGAGVSLLLVAVDRETAFGGHPANTTTGNEVSASLLFDDLESSATGLAIAPTGEVFFSELTGRMGVLTPAGDGYQAQILTRLDLAPGAGLFHVALHPQWPEEPFLYASVQHVDDGHKTLRVVRFETDGASIDSGTPLVADIPTPQVPFGASLNHFGSAIAICDGFFYLGTGDASFSARENIAAQIPNRAEGKILRYRLVGADLEPAGTIHDEPPVFAMGFRNPFAGACDPVSGLPLIADNGPGGHDQVRLVEPSSNHEWPLSLVRNLAAPPIYDTGEVVNIAPTGVAARIANDEVELMVAGFNTTSVYRIVQDEDGPTHLDVMRDDPEGAFSLAVGSDGCIYYGSANVDLAARRARLSASADRVARLSRRRRRPPRCRRTARGRGWRTGRRGRAARRACPARQGGPR